MTAETTAACTGQCPRCRFSGTMRPQWPQYPELLAVCPRCAFAGDRSHFTPVRLPVPAARLLRQMVKIALASDWSGAYAADLYVHDRNALASGYRDFAWGISDCSTHIIGGHDERAPALMIAIAVTYGARVAWYWSDGTTVTPCTYDQACRRLALSYARRIAARNGNEGDLQP